MKFRVISTILVLCLLLSVFSIGALAVNGETGGLRPESEGNEIESINDVITEILQSDLTDVEKAVAIAKIQAVLNNNVDAVTPKSTTNNILLSNFPWYGPDQSSYCVPATSKSILKYLTGVTYSQSYLASLMNFQQSSTTAPAGISLTDMKNGLNSLQSENLYVRMPYNSGITTFQNAMHTSLNNGVPCAAGIVTTSVTDWRGSAFGAHVTAVIGISSDKTLLSICDSGYTDPQNSNNHTFSIPTSFIYNGIAYNTAGGYLF